MADERKNTEGDSETRERWKTLKRDGETSDGLLRRGAVALETEAEGGRDETREIIREELQRFKDELLSELRR